MDAERYASDPGAFWLPAVRCYSCGRNYLSSPNPRGYCCRRMLLSIPPRAPGEKGRRPLGEEAQGELPGGVEHGGGQRGARD